MKSEQEIKDKLQVLKRDRHNLRLFNKQRGIPATLSDFSAHLTQLLAEHSISAKIDIVEGILKDHPF